ncbi:hypothetical protein E2C01_026700 [Portunus trituberculatus]|uniref:Uncharacterized protein n=1 Tax=Portunus trituberculatus TaxID=210409 RepID=A0A5B7EGS9_PORTR|nr:hypothetical protein [Portunus trituberculatus]
MEETYQPFSYNVLLEYISNRGCSATNMASTSSFSLCSLLYPTSGSKSPYDPDHSDQVPAISMTLLPLNTPQYHLSVRMAVMGIAKKPRETQAKDGMNERTTTVQHFFSPRQPHGHCGVCWETVKSC